MDKKISFVIPSFNYGDYIKPCLQSIVDQRCESCEIIVVDDGSTDNTRNVIENFFKDLAGGQFRYYYQDNSGPSAARNNGALQAQGEFVWFVDADDCLLPGVLVPVMEALENLGQKDFLFGGHIYVNEKGKKYIRPATSIGSVKDENFKKIVTRKLHGISIGSLIVRRSVFERLCFPEGVHNNEDNIFFAHLLASRQGVSLPVLLAKKIGHKDSLRYNTGAVKESGLTVDRLFDDKILNRKQMSMKNIYLSNNYFAIFRCLYREKQYKQAFRFYQKSIFAYPMHLFDWHRFKKAVHCLGKLLIIN